jgi:hypothetical protein
VHLFSDDPGAMIGSTRSLASLCVAALATTALLVGAGGCSLTDENVPPPTEPRFAPGEYGGDPLPGTEALYNLAPSPSGDRIALIRERTPGVPSDPRNQLWITRHDGSSPRLIGVNTGTVDWAPDGEKLSVTVVSGINVYAYTIDLETLETTQWTGRDDQRLSFPVVSNPTWFQDSRRLLVSVAQEAYQQPFSRGIYVIDTRDTVTTGPLVELMQAAYLGHRDRYVTGRKYVRSEDPLSGNYARYDFTDSTWHWITDFSKDSLDLVGTPVPSPTQDLLVQSREVENADQLFLMNSQGENVRQITKLGGDNPQWSPDGSNVVFRRDVNQGKGARYVPFRFDLDAMQAEPLWPALPDSVPDFPDLSAQTLRKVSLDAEPTASPHPHGLTPHPPR